MIGVPPFRGEFGIMIRFHAAAVRAMGRPILVAHEAGLEALYPDVTERWIVEPLSDENRRWTYGHDADYVGAWRSKIAGKCKKILEPDKTNRLRIRPFIPSPYEAQRGSGAGAPDVVVCPRMREYGPDKNWPEWPNTIASLASYGLSVFVAGQQETSYPLPASVSGLVERAWDYERPLDATIEAMVAAKATLATASGLSLLAVMCGSPLFLVAAQGLRVAPGPSRDLSGKIRHERYWEVPLEDYYEPLKVEGSEIHTLSGAWEESEMALSGVLTFLAGKVVAA